MSYDVAGAGLVGTGLGTAMACCTIRPTALAQIVWKTQGKIMQKVPRMTRKAHGTVFKKGNVIPDVCRGSLAEGGFTLIEVMIVVVVVAILAAIAIPSYRNFILKSHRDDAKTALAALQMAQEKYRGNNLTYAAALSDLGLTAASPQGYYTIAIQSAAVSAYEANATTTGQQSADTNCQKLAVTQAGFSTDSTKTSNPSECWGL